MNFEILSNLLAIIGGIILALIWIPQIYKIYKTKSANDVSYSTLIM